LSPAYAAIPIILLASTILTGCGHVPIRANERGSSNQSYEAMDNKDVVPRKETLLSGPKRPYDVLGVHYVPMKSLFPFREKGVASWYGGIHQGRATSTGEIFDTMKLTAAHPTLPLPSYVRVTNLDNGKSIIVRVNDRGPFVKKRIIDLSYAAATKLDYIKGGSANVEIELIIP
jgi:rare lipoprotein A